MDYKKYIEFINQKSLFVAYNHIRMIGMERDRAVVELIICRDSHNPLGYLHGGAYFTMADFAASAAARSNGMQYVTLNSSFEFVKNIKNGRVIATAAVRHRGRTTCLLAAEVTDEQGNLLAEGRFTMFCLNVPVNLE